ncbi:MAG: superoxide dismutase [Cu-Zn] SodC [Marinobacter sp.]
MKKSAVLAAILAGTLSSFTLADSGNTQEIEMFALDAKTGGHSIGSVYAQEHDDGVLFTPKLKGLEPGIHGFHVHEKASCESSEKDGKMVLAGAAGGHFNPDSGDHNGPYKDGHAGDLPALYVDESGKAATPVLATNLDFDDLKGRALMIHAQGDNYSDKPKPLGGGGDRVACGALSDK